MINNKGFTLVELLGVIVILSIIAAIAIPTVSTSLNKQKTKELEHKKEQIVSKVELYYEKIKNNNNLSNKSDFSKGSCYITLEWLKENDFVTGKQIDGLDEKDGVYRNPKDNLFIFEYIEKNSGINSCT